MPPGAGAVAGRAGAGAVTGAAPFADPPLFFVRLDFFLFPPISLLFVRTCASYSSAPPLLTAFSGLEAGSVPAAHELSVH